MAWEYLTRSYRFQGPDADDWPGRERYADLLREQIAEREAREKARQGGLGYMSSRYIGRIGHEEVVESEEGERLAAAYRAWRDRVELDYLNEFGEAGFELVAVTRDVRRERNTPDFTFIYAFPVISVFCYFKRPKTPNAPEPPKRSIGFQPPGER